MHRFLVLLSGCTLMAGCALNPALPSNGTVTLKLPAPPFVPLVLEDARVATVHSADLQTEYVLPLQDANLRPAPLPYLQAALASQLHASEWRVQVSEWLRDRKVTLTRFDARAVRRAAKPVDTNKDMYAVVNPAAPLLAIGVESLVTELSRPRYVELDITLAVGTRRFEAGGVTRLASGDVESALNSLLAQAVESLAHQLAEESVGLSASRARGTQ